MIDKSYSRFEIAMSQIFFHSYGGSTEDLEEQSWWEEIQDLKKAAQEEKENA